MEPGATAAASVFYEPDAGIQVWARDNYGSEQARVAEAGLQGGVRPWVEQGSSVT